MAFASIDFTYQWHSWHKPFKEDLEMNLKWMTSLLGLHLCIMWIAEAI